MGQLGGGRHRGEVLQVEYPAALGAAEQPAEQQGELLVAPTSATEAASGEGARTTGADATAPRRAEANGTLREFVECRHGRVGRRRRRRLGKPRRE